MLSRGQRTQVSEIAAARATASHRVALRQGDLGQERQDRVVRSQDLSSALTGAVWHHYLRRNLLKPKLQTRTHNNQPRPNDFGTRLQFGMFGFERRSEQLRH